MQQQRQTMEMQRQEQKRLAEESLFNQQRLTQEDQRIAGLNKDENRRANALAGLNARLSTAQDTRAGERAQLEAMLAQAQNSRDEAQATLNAEMARSADSRAGAESSSLLETAALRRQQSQTIIDELTGRLNNIDESPAPILPRVDLSPAHAARMGQAKEQIGETTQGSLSALDDILAEGGFTEAPMGGAEAALRAGVVQQGSRGVADVTRANLIQGAEQEERENALQFQANTNRQRDIQNQRLALLELLERAGGRLF